MLQLREVTPDDEKRLLEWRNDEAVARYMYTDHRITPAEHEQWFNGIINDPRSRYWIIVVDDDPVGLANVVDINYEARRCSKGLYLASPLARGKGIGTWVEYQIGRFAFDSLDFHKLCCEALETNRAAIQLYESVGFRREGYLREHIWREGKPHNVVALGLLRSEWADVQSSIEQQLRAKGLL